MLKNAQIAGCRGVGALKENQAKMTGLEGSTDKITGEVLDKRVSLALLEYRRANAISTSKKSKNPYAKPKKTSRQLKLNADAVW